MAAKNLLQIPQGLAVPAEGALRLAPFLTARGCIPVRAIDNALVLAQVFADQTGGFRAAGPKKQDAKKKPRENKPAGRLVK